MNLKQTALMFLFFVCFNGCATFSKDKSAAADSETGDSASDGKIHQEEFLDFNPAPPKSAPVSYIESDTTNALAITEDASFTPVTWEIANILYQLSESGTELNKLKFRLSRPFTMIITNNTRPRINNDDGALVLNEQITKNIQSNTDDDIDGEGTLRTFYAGTFVIDFQVEEELISIGFTRNSQQDKYFLSYAEITGAQRYVPESNTPYLLIKKTGSAGSDKTNEIQFFPVSSQENTQRRTGNVPQTRTGNQGGSQSYQNINIHQSYVIPSRNILDTGSVSKRGVADYIRSVSQNPVLRYADIERLINIYFNEADFEGVNRDIAIAQMLYWTNSLGNRERIRSNNYGGLSANGVNWNGSFPRLLSDGMTEGVRAHIQHLKAYASPYLNNPQVVDPRFRLLGNIRGSVQTVDRLYEIWSPYNWASYGNSINRILVSLYRFSGAYR